MVPFSHDASWCQLRAPCGKEGDDSVWSLISCGHFLARSSLCAIRDEKKKVILIITLAGRQSLMFALPLLCKCPCPYASTSSVVFKYSELFFYVGLFLLLYRHSSCSCSALCSQFFFPLHFFFLSCPSLFHQVCVFRSLTGAFMRAAALKATYIIKRVSYQKYICVTVFRY